MQQAAHSRGAGCAAATALLSCFLEASSITTSAAPQTFLSSHVARHVSNSTQWRGPEHADYNEETDVPGIPFSVEFLLATVFVVTMASAPAVLCFLVGQHGLTFAHKVESLALIAWLAIALYSSTHVLKFNSSHWSGSRPLTLVEAVYFLAQILTTVGYGDITPAYPRGQVSVALNVILALCLYGSMVMEVVDLVQQRVATALLRRFNRAGEDVDPLEAEMSSHRPLRRWALRPPPVHIQPMAKSLSAFVFFTTAGVLFWHLYPGEGKTWFQAVYMSVITLSTVGFGWLTATTEGGKVFGAFWMLFGVASLAAVVGSFVELMIQLKCWERHDSNAEKVRFFRYIRLCARPLPKIGDSGMDSYDFLKFGVLLQKLATEEQLQAIEDRFGELADADGKVSCDKLAETEGPPPELLLRRAIAAFESGADVAAADSAGKDEAAR